MKTNRINASYSTSNSIAGSTSNSIASRSSYKSSKFKDAFREQNRKKPQKKKQVRSTRPGPSLKLLNNQYLLNDNENPGPPPTEPVYGQPPPAFLKASWRESTKNTINNGVDKIFDMLDDGKAKCVEAVNEAINGAKQKFIEAGRKFLDSIEKL